MTAPHQRAARSGGDLRVLRAAVFAAVCVVLAAAGHGLASCATIPLWTLGAGFLAVFAVAATLAGRERSLPAIAAVLALGQTALHTLFGLGQHGGTSMTSGMSMADTSLVERAARLDVGTAHSMHHSADAVSAMSTTAGSAMSPLPSVTMLLAHVLAAVAAGWALRRGDLAVLRLLRLSAEGSIVRSLRGAFALVRTLSAGLPSTPEARPRVPCDALLPQPRTTALQHTVIRRGPPSATALVLTA